jgi:hypothetical protein
MNRMLWRNHPVVAIRLAMARRCTVDGFWLPMARSLGLCLGYGASMVEGTTRTSSPRRPARSHPSSTGRRSSPSRNEKNMWPRLES